MYIYVYICIHMDVCIDMYICMNIYVFVCVFICINPSKVDAFVPPRGNLSVVCIYVANAGDCRAVLCRPKVDAFGKKILVLAYLATLLRNLMHLATLVVKLTHLAT